MNEQNKIIAWEAPEFVYHPKTPAWHVIYFIIAGGLVSYAVYTGSVITIIMFLLLAVVGWVFANKHPNTIQYQLTAQGVIFKNEIMPYKNIKRFWIIYQPSHTKTLNLETTAVLNRFVSIELGKTDPVAVKTFLSQYITEDLDSEESLTDVIARKAKF